MAKIKQIEIRNFKFFTDDVPPLALKDNSDHVLLYGENGSGKSTLNWALYTLLESANKTNSADIEKYFDERDPQNLLNIHTSTRATDAFVKVTLDDGSLWQIAHGTPTINGNSDAKNSNLASDFINYRMLYRLLDFRNSQDIDLFTLFEAEVMDYLAFGAAVKIVPHLRPETIIGKVWKQIMDGPNKLTVPGSTTLQYPTSGSIVSDLRNGIDKFRIEFGKLIDGLNEKANKILNDDLKIDLKFKLELVEVRAFVINATEYQPPVYQIDLKVEKVVGKTPPTTNIKPHIFLNEARLTAIGLAIRLSILEKRLATAKLKLLVLDDLLISLDMGNRMKVVEMLLKHYCNRYQVFILTHDRNFYEFVKFRIEQDKYGEQWNFWEAYNDQEGAYEKPVFKLNQTNLARAEALFQEFDYPASGNYLRKAIEEFVDKWLPVWRKVDRDYKPIDLSKKLALGATFLQDSGISNTIIKDLDRYRKFILNASSHADYDTPIFKPELRACINTLKEDVPKFRFENILARQEQLNLKFTNRAGNIVLVEITILEPASLLKWDNDPSELSVFLGKVEETIGGVAKSAPEYNQFNLKNLYNKYLTQSNSSLNADFWEEFKLKSGQLLKTKRKF
jgi:energy-coupling factor transporter ATP-binding protein EcfA2